MFHGADPGGPVPGSPRTPCRALRPSVTHRGNTRYRPLVDNKDIANRFTFHGASRQKNADAHAGVRTSCQLLAEVLNEVLPEGREKSLAITHLETVMFWGNAAIARHSGD